MKKLYDDNLSFKIASVRDFDKETVLVTTAIWSTKEGGRVMELFHAFPKSKPLADCIFQAKTDSIADFYGESTVTVKVEPKSKEPAEEFADDVKVMIGDTPIEKVKTKPKKKARKKRTVAKKVEALPIVETQDEVLEVIRPTVVYDSSNEAQRAYIRKLVTEKLPTWETDKLTRARVVNAVSELTKRKCFYDNNEPTEEILNFLGKTIFAGV